MTPKSPFQGFRLFSPYRLLAISLCFSAGSCDRSTKDTNRLTLFAASSVADVMTEIAARFETERKVPVVISQGSSGKLCRQLQLGADCDLFVPADVAYLDLLHQSEKVLDSSRTALAWNELVVVMAGFGHKVWTEAGRLRQGPLESLVIANPDHAPAGQYAVQALERAGLWQTLQPRTLYADNVRLAARYVADGGIQAGILYATDALAFQDRVSVVYRFSPSDHREILYEGAVCAGAANRERAQAFLRFASSTEVDEIWRNHGFVRRDRTLDTRKRR
ncbi:MAG: molybdate ABC transporter substrate-binding protein [Phycisphaerales bacterium]|nr:molybdate ABC transporter substrate-binding protein [Phycisphaerales bacterium]